MAKSVAVTGGYSIDATEVTRDQYAAWLAGAPSTSGQDARCSWNTDFTPSCEWPAGAKGNHPVVCVDWCDAFAYCRAVGKRLCGRIGGGENGWDNYANASLSQWHSACSSGGVNDYPYGDILEATTCNGYGAGKGVTVPVGTMTGCKSSVSGYGGVYDLSGNVWEWEDSCNGTATWTDSCRLRGGAFDAYGEGYLRCGYGLGNNRGSHAGDVGFRCCAP